MKSRRLQRMLGRASYERTVAVNVQADSPAVAAGLALMEASGDFADGIIADKGPGSARHACHFSTDSIHSIISFAMSPLLRSSFMKWPFPVMPCSSSLNRVALPPAWLRKLSVQW